MTDEPKTFWAKVAIITGLLTAIATLLGIFYQIGLVGNIRTPNGSPGQELRRQDEEIARPEPDQIKTAVPQNEGRSNQAIYCCDISGFKRCPLIAPVPVGTSCFCPGQGYGFACQ